jgi:hypothetical protein
MLKAIFAVGMIFCASIAPGFAGNLAFPAKDPIATLSIPDSWAMEEIEWGYSATSPD